MNTSLWKPIGSVGVLGILMLSGCAYDRYDHYSHHPRMHHHCPQCDGPGAGKPPGPMSMKECHCMDSHKGAQHSPPGSPKDQEQH